MYFSPQYIGNSIVAPDLVTQGFKVTVSMPRGGGGGGHLNMKMSSYQYRDPHVKDKTVLRLSYLSHGNPHTWERQPVYWDGVLVLISRNIPVSAPERRFSADFCAL